MASRVESVRRCAVASLAVLAGMGAAALKPRAAYGSCDVGSQITQIKDEIRSGDSFKQRVLLPAHPRSVEFVKVFAKHDPESRKPFMVYPLVIACGSKAVRYAGLTNSRNSLGQRYDTGFADRTGKVYLDVVKPSDTTTEADLGLGNAQGVAPQDQLRDPVVTVRFADVYDPSLQTYYPALAGPHPSVSPLGKPHDIFGATVG